VSERRLATCRSRSKFSESAGDTAPSRAGPPSAEPPSNPPQASATSPAGKMARLTPEAERNLQSFFCLQDTLTTAAAKFLAKAVGFQCLTLLLPTHNLATWHLVTEFIQAPSNIIRVPPPPTHTHTHHITPNHTAPHQRLPRLIPAIDQSLSFKQPSNRYPRPSGPEISSS